MDSLKTDCCPLCGSTLSNFISRAEYSDIWRHLAQEWGASFSDSVIIAHTPSAQVDLKECSDCFLQYFAPAIPGSDIFYSELTSSSASYYNGNKWEFEFVRTLLSSNDTVLDIGCGYGAFLHSIKSTVKIAVGIETNHEAAEKGVSRGLCIDEVTIEDFSMSHSEEFSVVTAFQVIEHIAAVMPFVEAAYKCVKPGGRLIISVPNRYRRRMPGFGSLDYPPHHISRWTKFQLTTLSKMLNAHSVRIEKQPLTSIEIAGALRIKEMNLLFPADFFGKKILIRLVTRALLTFPLSAAFYGLKFHEKLEMHGLALVAIIQKPV